MWLSHLSERIESGTRAAANQKQNRKWRTINVLGVFGELRERIKTNGENVSMAELAQIFHLEMLWPLPSEIVRAGVRFGIRYHRSIFKTRAKIVSAYAI